MPIYEYQCGACQARLEKLQKMSDPPLLTCPECGADALVKLVSAAGFRLKGSGWYETDFKKDGKRNLAGDHPPGADKTSGGDSKPAGDKSSSVSGDAGAGSSTTSSKSADKPAAAKPSSGSAA